MRIPLLNNHFEAGYSLNTYSHFQFFAKTHSTGLSNIELSSVLIKPSQCKALALIKAPPNSCFFCLASMQTGVFSMFALDTWTVE